jgi:hypothetical protein
MQIDSLIGQIAAGSTAVLFASSALHKLYDWQRFKGAVAGYQLLPDNLTSFIAPLVLLVEIAVVPLVCLGATRSLGALTAATLLLTYAVGIAINLMRGRTRIDCGCLGPRHRQRISSALLLRNGVLAGIAVVAALPNNQRAFEAIDWLTLFGGVAMLALLYAIAEQLIANPGGTATSQHGAHA